MLSIESKIDYYIIKLIPRDSTINLKGNASTEQHRHAHLGITELRVLYLSLIHI